MGEIGGFGEGVKQAGCQAVRLSDADGAPTCSVMDIRRLSVLAVLVALMPRVGAAEPGRSFTSLSYATHVAGMRVMVTEADIQMDARGYRVDIAARTAGAYGVLFRGETRTVAQGLWAGTLVAPQRYAVDGIWRGAPRRTLMDFDMGQPNVRQLEPPNEAEREPVPVSLQRETIDTISAAAQLARRATLTGRCEGQARTFDGRRLFEVEARTGGMETLAADEAPVSGPLLRCDFEGRLLAGFMLDGDRDAAARPQKGSAWFARLGPDSPLLPVRLRFEIRWLGSATMTLTSARADGPPLVRVRADTDAGPLRR